jgi:hypothetical protein
MSRCPSPPPPRASPPRRLGSWIWAPLASGRRKDTRDVAAGRALIPDKPRLVLERSNPHHFFHRGLAAGARKGAPLLRQIRHDAFPLTIDNAPQHRRLRHHGPFCGRKISVKKPCSRRGRPARVTAIRAVLMPIRTFLGGHRFDGETVRLMGIAFETALASLRSAPDCTDPVREAIARKIIELAKAGERDPERLCDEALKGLRPIEPPAAPGQSTPSVL